MSWESLRFRLTAAFCTHCKASTSGKKFVRVKICSKPRGSSRPLNDIRPRRRLRCLRRTDFGSLPNCRSRRRRGEGAAQVRGRSRHRSDAAFRSWVDRHEDAAIRPRRTDQSKLKPGIKRERRRNGVASKPLRRNQRSTRGRGPGSRISRTKQSDAKEGRTLHRSQSASRGHWRSTRELQQHLCSDPPDYFKHAPHCQHTAKAE